MIYFTADTHFYHENIIKYCDRPFHTIEEMNYVMVDNWNKTVKQSDDVYILGDLAFARPEQVNDLLKSLNGRKYLIKGNHDSFLKESKFDKSLFQWIKDYYVLRNDNKKYVLFHYPIHEWDGAYHGSIHLYGHIHNTYTPDLKNAYNVGVDMCKFRPISIEEINKKGTLESK